MITTPQEVLDFWFVECEPSDWFKKSEEFDNEIRSRFLETYEAIVAGKTTEWRRSAIGRLAEIVVLDQFSRNMFRDDARAFVSDALAVELAKEAMSLWDEFSIQERSFVVMPFMHSESLAVHDWAAKWFDEPGLERRKKYELQHREIIERFGRYPHRNRVLGRTSTPEEEAFLKEHPGF